MFKWSTNKFQTSNILLTCHLYINNQKNKTSKNIQSEKQLNLLMQHNNKLLNLNQELCPKTPYSVQHIATNNDPYKREITINYIAFQLFDYPTYRGNITKQNSKLFEVISLLQITLKLTTKKTTKCKCILNLKHLLTYHLY